MTGIGIDVDIDLAAIGVALDEHGPTDNEVAVRAVIRLARNHGIDGVAVNVLADTTAPDVARLRAFAVVSAQLARRVVATSAAPLAPVA